MKLSEDLIHISPVSMINLNLYSFKYFKKYILEKFSKSSKMIVLVVKNTLSAIEALKI